MNQITTNGKKFGIVDVLDVDHRFKIFNDEQPYLSCFRGVDTRRIYLPPGKWKFLTTYKQCSEEVAAEIVQQMTADGRYRNYWPVSQYSECLCDTALDSLHTVFASLNLDPSNNYALLQKID